MEVKSIRKLYELIAMIKYRSDMLKKQQFTIWYKVLKKNLHIQNENVFVNAIKILNIEVCLLLELINVHIGVFECRKEKYEYE